MKNAWSCNFAPHIIMVYVILIKHKANFTFIVSRPISGMGVCFYLGIVWKFTVVEPEEKNNVGPD
jgi:hypothetical protein